MPEPRDNREDELKTENEGCDVAAIRNSVLFSIAAVAVGSAIYYIIKKNRKLKREKELLEYEVWG